eukprot:m.62433 g.62433  ORF g.62433 m.62433 type:complete len:292 (+) comp35069_c0_seq3:37-912(+)
MEKEDEEEKRREELLSRHRQEMKELRSRILAARKDLKGDKKEKKRRLAELEKLEKELKERQEREKSEISEVEEKTATPLVLEASDKKSRAQRRKERKSAEAKERMARVLADEKEDEKTSLRRLERDDLSEILSQHNRSIYEIEPDGNCLYRAIGHQLQLIRAEKSYSVARLRSMAAEEISTNRDTYLPFLLDSDESNSSPDEKIEGYCRKLTDTTSWGGHIEIQALCSKLGCAMHVYQASGSPLVFQQRDDAEDSSSGCQPPCLYLVYHRHEFGLGEHYNSTVIHSSQHNS